MLQWILGIIFVGLIVFAIVWIVNIRKNKDGTLS